MTTREGQRRSSLAVFGLLVGGLVLACSIASAAEPAKGTWHQIVCTCGDMTSVQPVDVNACLDPKAENIELGAGLVCGASVAGSIRLVTGLRTVCVYSRMSNTGQGPCTPGRFSIVKIGRRTLGRSSE